MVLHGAKRHRAYGRTSRLFRALAAWFVGYLYLVGLAFTIKFIQYARALKQLLRIVKFAGVGITVALIGYGLLYVLVDVVGLSERASFLVDAVVSVELNFLGSRYITWRDRLKHSGFRRSWLFFHGARSITFGINQGLFSLQLLVFSTWPEFFDFSFRGENYGYLVANTACILVGASFNYAANDEYTFAGRRVDRLANTETAVIRRLTISVIIPCKNSPVGDTVRTILNQDYYKLYPENVEIILVGDRDDPSWQNVQEEARAGLVRIIELPVRSPGRDANAKRNVGLLFSKGKAKWFIDADVFAPPYLLTLIVDRLTAKGMPIVAGPVPSTEDQRRKFWPLFIDSAGGKTPRWVVPYILTMENLGLFKFPVTANLAFLDEVWRKAGGPAVEFTNSYEDYEWLLRMLEAGYPILCDPALAAPREHRTGWRRLKGELVRSGRGCADFMVKHRQNLFTVWRLMMMISLPFGVVALGAVAIPLPALALVLVVAFVISRMLAALVKARFWDPRVLLFPFIGWFFSACFVYGNFQRFFTRDYMRPQMPRVGRPHELNFTTYTGGHRTPDEEVQGGPQK